MKLPFCLEESIEAKEGHSTKLSFSEEEKAEVIVSETFGVLLLQEGQPGTALRNFTATKIHDQ